MSQELLLPAEGLENGALPQRRGAGRPVGARNKRSLDLARYIEATYDGMTPGQQAAAIALISGADIDEAPEAAKQLGLVDLGLDRITLAMTVKATRLAKALRCLPMEAWALMARERDGLMRYVHQVQPPARGGEKPPAQVYVVPEGEVADVTAGELPGDEQDPDFFGVLDEPADAVSREGSHAEPET